LTLTSNFLIACACSGGVCGVSKPLIPTDIQNNSQLKPFNASNKEITDKKYSGWIVGDNTGDTIAGENRVMVGMDANSIMKDGDKFVFFGLVSDENLKSGKLSYASPISWHDLILEVSYIQTNYSFGGLVDSLDGIGTTRSVEGKVIYPFIKSDREILNFSLSVRNNNIEEETRNDLINLDSEKSSYSATALFDFESKKYPLFNFDTSHKLSLGLTAGNLSFDNINDERLDELTFNTQGTYSKINLDYKNIISPTKNLIFETNFRSQFALDNKNLDDSESFTIGGFNGVKIYEENAVYDSNGIFVNVEAKYKLPDVLAVKNSVGVFYEYGQIWQSESLFDSDDSIAVQDAGVGVYTNYKKFFSKVQVAFEIEDSEIPTKDEEEYRVLFQAGIVF
jgi:hemolysin activation/secretion protein